MIGEKAKMMLIQILQKHFKDNHFELTFMSGDAGTRRYSRLVTDDGTFVVMELRRAVDPRSEPFFRIRDYLASNRIPVPDIHFIDEESGVVVMDDLGDETLQARFQRDPRGTIGRLYPKAMEMMFELQNRCRSDPEGLCPAFSIRFDTETFFRELLFFETHFLDGYLSLSFSGSFRRTYRQAFRELAGFLDAQPEVFTHRDYHSRNLMVLGDDLVLIDFQDARLGCPEYDLVSLLRDAYVRLPESVIGTYFRQHHERTLRRSLGWDQYRELAALMCIQRAFKAMGTFGYQATVRGNDTYLRYVPTLIHHLNIEIDRADRPYIKPFKILLDEISSRFQ